MRHVFEAQPIEYQDFADQQLLNTVKTKEQTTHSAAVVLFRKDWNQHE